VGSQNWVEKCPDSAPVYMGRNFDAKQSGASIRVFQT